MTTPNTDLVLSLFPGIGLLDMAFEQAGYCVVRGPDLLWGGDVRRFHAPAGRFDGIIGGPPCQAFSRLRHMVIAVHGADRLAPNLIPEFERCVYEATPGWFLMENVPDAPVPQIDGYATHSFVFNNRWCGGEQERKRRFTFGLRGGDRRDLRRWIDVTALETVNWSPAVLASGGGGNGYAVRLDREGKPKSSRNRMGEKHGRGSRMLVADGLRLQGLPADFFAHSPLTVEGQQRMLGNGVPLPLGRAIAGAVRTAMEQSSKFVHSTASWEDNQ